MNFVFATNYQVVVLPPFPTIRTLISLISIMSPLHTRNQSSHKYNTKNMFKIIAILITNKNNKKKDPNGQLVFSYF
jgi:hypothetical protein